jgi:ABC-type lipoprotein export system ATPase subunit
MKLSKIYSEGWKVLVFLFSNSKKQYSLSIFMLLIATILETLSIVFVVKLVVSIFKNEERINVDFFDNNIFFDISFGIIILIAVVVISSFLYFLSSKIFFNAYKCLEGRIIKELLPSAYYEIIKEGKEKDSVIAEKITILNQDVRILSEANYYARFLMESFSYIIVYCLAILLISPSLGSVFIFLTVLLVLFSGGIGESKSKSDAVSTDSSVFTPTELMIWIIKNYKYVYSGDLLSSAFIRFFKISSKNSDALVNFYILADLKRAITIPILVIFLLVFSFVLTKYFGENMMTSAALLFLIYRVLPRFSYVNSQFKNISRGYEAYKKILINMKSKGNKYFSFTNKNIKLNNIVNISIKVNDSWTDLLGGKVYCIKGVSGSGKTSLLDSIAGIRKVFTNNVLRFNNEEHRVLYFNQEIVASLPATLKNLKSTYGIEEDVEFLENYANQLGVKIVKENLDCYSSGERQRIALAWFLSKNSQIMLLDEPTSALDKKSELKFIELLKHKCKKEFLIVICITHSEQFLSHVDEVLDINDVIQL